MNVSDFMTTEVVTVEIPGNRDDVLKILKRTGISGVPVLKEGKLVGIDPANINRFMRSLPHEHQLTLLTDMVDKWGALGADDATDILSVSLSGHDYVNHAWGMESRISHDHLLQLDNHTVKTNLDVNLQSPGGTPAPTQFRVLGGKVDVAGEGTIDGNVRARGGAGNQYFVFGEMGKPVPHIVNVTGGLSADMGPGGENFPASGPPDAVGSVGIPPAAGAGGDIARLNVRRNVDVRNTSVFVIAVIWPRSLYAHEFVARLPGGWAVMGDPQVLAGYCLLLPDPVVPTLNEAEAIAASEPTPRNMTLMASY